MFNIDQSSGQQKDIILNVLATNRMSKYGRNTDISESRLKFTVIVEKSTLLHQ
jgi:hypothetical protein